MPNIFNSLGSNYDQASGAYRLRLGGAGKQQQLKNYLEQRYQGTQTELVYKGREALTMALQALQLPAGSYVAINGYTCYAVYQAVIAANLKPYYLDIPADGLDFTAGTLQQALQQQPSISAVMIQNTLGVPVDLTAIKRMCKEKKVPIVEDMAHCIGMRYADGSEAGTQTEAAALSFSQDKMIDAVTGGAVVVRVGRVTAPSRPAGLRIRSTARVYPWLIGFIRQTHHLGVGKVLLRIVKKLRLIPGPMSGEASPPHMLPGWNAGLALRAFDRLDDTIAHRQKIAAIYRELLPKELQFAHANEAIYLRFPLKIEGARELTRYLRRFGIELGTPWYDAPIAPKRLFGKTDYVAGSCPQAEWLAQHMINLPTHVHVNEQTARTIAERINQWLQSSPNQ